MLLTLCSKISSYSWDRRNEVNVLQFWAHSNKENHVAFFLKLPSYTPLKFQMTGLGKRNPFYRYSQASVLLSCSVFCQISSSVHLEKKRPKKQKESQPPIICSISLRKAEVLYSFISRWISILDILYRYYVSQVFILCSCILMMHYLVFLRINICHKFYLLNISKSYHEDNRQEEQQIAENVKMRDGR